MKNVIPSRSGSARRRNNWIIFAVAGLAVVALYAAVIYRALATAAP